MKIKTFWITCTKAREILGETPVQLPSLLQERRYLRSLDLHVEKVMSVGKFMVERNQVERIRMRNELCKLLETITEDAGANDPRAQELRSKQVTEALRSLEWAAADYILGTRQAKVRPDEFSVSNQRRSLKSLLSKLKAARDEAKNLPISARSLFAIEYKTPFEPEVSPDIVGQPESIEFVDPRELGSSLLKLSMDLDNMVATAERALEIAKKRDNKPSDADRKFLAYQVALVFQDVLKLKPASTHDKGGHVNSKRGGAAYARVLRTVFEMAGIQNPAKGTPLDLQHDIKDGLDLLRDHNLED